MSLFDSLRGMFRPKGSRKAVLTSDIAAGLKARQYKSKSMDPKQRIPRRLFWSVGEYGTINKTNFRAIYIMKKSHPWLRSCLRATKKQMIKSGWDVVPINKNEAYCEDARKRIKEFFENCNSQTPFDDLLIEWWEDKATYGDGFLEVVINEVSGEPDSLWYVIPETMRILANEHGEVLAYPQVVDGSLVATFDQNEMLHWKEGYDDYSLFGMGRIESLLGAIAVDLMADDHTGCSWRRTTGRFRVTLFLRSQARTSLKD